MRVELEALRARPTTLTTSAVATSSATRAPLWKRLLPIAAAIVLTAAATALVLERRRSAAVPEVVRLTIPAEDMRLTLNALAIAPGGAAIAYAAVTTSGTTLMVRRLSEFEAKPVETTRGLPINYPTFFARRWIARVRLGSADSSRGPARRRACHDLSGVTERARTVVARGERQSNSDALHGLRRDCCGLICWQSKSWMTA